MGAEFVRERITQLRVRKDVSEYKMSYDLGHSRGYINNISSGKTLPSMTEFLPSATISISPGRVFPCNKRQPEVVQRNHGADLPVK